MNSTHRNIQEKKVVQTQFSTIYKLFIPLLFYLVIPPVFLGSSLSSLQKDGDDDAVDRMDDIKLAMSYGKASLDHLLDVINPLSNDLRLILSNLLSLFGRWSFNHSFTQTSGSFDHIKDVLLISSFFCLLLLSQKHCQNPVSNGLTVTSHSVGPAGFGIKLICPFRSSGH